MHLSNGVLFLETSETGARINTLQKGSKHFLFPQQIVLVEGDPKLRGGMHLCSPIFGKKKINPYDAIPQHGELRDAIWQLTPTANAAEARYTGDYTKHPYSLFYSISYRLGQNCLSTVASVKMLEGASVPLEFAWHPYFNAPNGALINIVGITNEPIIIVDKFGPEIYPVNEEITIELANIGTVRMFPLDGFSNRHVCIWTDWKDHYVCVELLLSHPDNFNSPAGAFLNRGQSITMKFEMDFK